MEGKKLPIVYSMLSYLLLSCFRLATGVGSQEGCPQFSCGQLHNIRGPFGPSGKNTSGCGNPVLPLLCINNRTVVYFHSNKYYVTEISYDDQTFKIEDADLADGSCVLPRRSLSDRMFLFDANLRYQIDGYFMTSWVESVSFKIDKGSMTWVSFLNCTREIKNQTYVPLPCLSHRSIFIYALSDSDPILQKLQPSCSFLAKAPSTNAIVPRSQKDVFQILQKGFTLSWQEMLSRNLTSNDIIHHCFSEASRNFLSRIGNNHILSLPYSLAKSENEFVTCLGRFRSGGSRSFENTFRVALVLLILIQILQVLIVLFIPGRFIFAPMMACIFLAHKFYRMKASVDTVEKFLQSQQALASVRYSYTDLIAMTSHFREKLGHGGFGSVFKGNFAGRLVAVKMLGNSKCNGDEFISEVSTIGRIHHVNVVQLVGFCSEGSKRALVYEYMPNGSLDKYIFSSNKTARPFTVEKLNEIALGVARGIDYLHRGCDMRILHFDIKPHNILLDKSFNPKVSDFGLAKLYPKDYSMVSFSATRGTIGYIAPELISRSFGVISYKSDVYSFGMLLLEMAGGRRNVNPRAENSSQVYYPSWIYDQLSKEEAPEFNNIIEIGEVERKLCKVGLWCIQMKPADRPSMSKVIEMLESDVDDLQMPPKPFFSSVERRVLTQSCIDSCPTELATISEDE